MKKLILLISIILLTGCSMQYDLLIKDDDTVEEKMVVPVSNDDMLKEFNTKDEYIDYYKNIYNGDKNYTITIKKGKIVSKFIAKRNFDSLDSYVDSKSYKSMFSDATILRVGDYLTFKTSKNLYLENIRTIDDYKSENGYKSFRINIQFYNEVVDNNADYIDEDKNVYTWDVTKENPKEHIMFKISNKKRYDVIIKDIIITNLLPIIFFGTIIVGAIILGLTLLIKKNKNNRI